MKSKTSKILAGMLTVGLCLSLSACGAKQEEPKQSKANETTQQTESRYDRSFKGRRRRTISRSCLR